MFRSNVEEKNAVRRITAVRYSEHPDDISSVPAKDGCVVLFWRPAGWIPSSELDMPKRAIVLEVVEQELSDPATYIRQYNAISLDQEGSTWAGISAAAPRKGEEVYLSR
jgi:hypothetical protein